jgi:hypothetical protein
MIKHQVVQVKKMAMKNASGDQPERYRLLVSDGEHYQQAMGASQLNKVGLLWFKCFSYH